MAKLEPALCSCLTVRPKVRLYTDETGGCKGDALISFVHESSVEIAIKYFDGASFREGGPYTLQVKRKHECRCLPGPSPGVCTLPFFNIRRVRTDVGSFCGTVSSSQTNALASLFASTALSVMTSYSAITEGHLDA